MLTALFALFTLMPLCASAQVGVTTLGTNAGQSNTTGDYNTYLGERAGQKHSTGSRGTFVGYGAGRWVDGDFDVTAVGYGAGAGSDAVTTEPTETPTPHVTDSTFIGTNAGLVCDGSDNTFIGTEAGLSNTTGADNTFVGEEAGEDNTTGSDNTFIGENAGANNTTGDDNTCVGLSCLSLNQTGRGNVALGFEAGFEVENSGNNTAVGYRAGTGIEIGECNTMLGGYTSGWTEQSSYNTMVGFIAGHNNDRGAGTTATANTYLGFAAGMTNRDGANNVVIGAYADFSDIDETTATTSCNNYSNFRGTPPSASSGSTNVSRVVGVGASLRITGADAVGIGADGVVTGAQCIAMGAEAQCTHAGAAAIGYQAASHGNNIIVIGNGTTASLDPNQDGTTALGSAAYRYSSVHAQSAEVQAAAGSDANVFLRADNAAANDDQWRVQAASDGGFSIASFATGTYAAILSLTNGGDMTVAGNITMNSDRRLKVDISPLADALAMVLQLQGKLFRWHPKLMRGDDLQVGMIAQEVAEVLPELVKEANGVLNVNYVGLVPVLVNAVGELNGQVEAQAKENAELRAQLAAQDERLKRLEAALATR